MKPVCTSGGAMAITAVSLQRSTVALLLKPFGPWKRTLAAPCVGPKPLPEISTLVPGPPDDGVTQVSAAPTCWKVAMDDPIEPDTNKVWSATPALGGMV